MKQLSLFERWKIDGELNAKYMTADAIISKRITIEQAKECFKDPPPEKWNNFLEFFEEYQKNHK